MRTLRIILFLFISLVYGPANAVHKCIAEDGKVSFQDRPCDEDSVSQDFEIKQNQSHPPFKISPENKRKYKLYTVYANQKINVDTCVQRKTDYAHDIKFAYERYYEIGKEELEEGKAIFNAGFEGLPGSEIRDIQSKALEKRELELANMSQDSLNTMCREHASKLRRLALQFKKRSSGYAEGDLDPEGND